MKRIAAIVLPDLLCELALQHQPEDESTKRAPLGVIVDNLPIQPAAGNRGLGGFDHGQDSGQDAGAILDAVDRKAWRYGARPGQSASEASAFVGAIKIVRISRFHVLAALAAVAELALGLGTNAALSLKVEAHHLGAGHVHGRTSRKKNDKNTRASPHRPKTWSDTVWLDVTGCARLIGGEDILCADLREKAHSLGHKALVCIADGPRLAHAIARFSGSSGSRHRAEELVALPGQAAEMLSGLPIAALPIDREMLIWFGKLGVFSIADVRRLERTQLAHRLGRSARDLLEFIAGRDDVPLCSYEPSRSIHETMYFDNSLSGSEPLLFVLRGLSARAIARLQVRGEACSSALLTIELDRGIMSLQTRSIHYTNRTLSADEPEPKDRLVERYPLHLPVALSKEEELMRALRAKLEGFELLAPVVSVGLTLEGLTPKTHHQLDLTRQRLRDPDAMPMLLAELCTWLGESRVGVLEQIDSHRPEARSRLGAVDLAPIELCQFAIDKVCANIKDGSDLAEKQGPVMTRILATPVLVGKLQPEQLAHVGNSLYIIDELKLETRLSQVEWWSEQPLSRDYARAWIHDAHQFPGDGSLSSSSKTDKTPAEHCEAAMFVDRFTGRGFLHGWYD